MTLLECLWSISYHEGPVKCVLYYICYLINNKESMWKNELPIVTRKIIMCQDLPVPKSHVYTILFLISHFQV